MTISSNTTYVITGPDHPRREVAAQGPLEAVKRWATRENVKWARAYVLDPPRRVGITYDVGSGPHGLTVRQVEEYTWSEDLEEVTLVHHGRPDETTPQTCR